MGDDEERRRKRRAMTDSERSALMRRTRRTPSGVPLLSDPGDDEITEPERILGREITELELELLARLGIDASDVVTMGDLAKLLLRVNKRDKKQDSGNNEMGRQIQELRQILDTPPNALAKEVTETVDTLRGDVDRLKGDNDKLHGGLRWARGVAAAAVVAALGSIGTGAAKLYGLGEQEGEAVIRLGHLERDVDQLRSDAREDRSRASHQFQLPPTAKGTTP